jgi:CDP-diacylglycerol--glycerol-3-phosphate 3-phosphatidyltransferase/cardiolipin synthase
MLCTMNVPTLLTWLRMAAIPLVVGVYALPPSWMDPHARNLAAALLFVLAGLTDWFDGFLARRWNQVSAFGAFLDPVADKLMVSAALLVLLELGRIGSLVALIIIGREIAISALREWMARIGRSRAVAVNWLGKVKTATQMVAIPLLLYDGRLFGWFSAAWWGGWLLDVAAALTLWSMLYYFRLALAGIQWSD